MSNLSQIANDEIVVGFSTAQGKYNIIAALIRFFEKTSYSHCYVRWYSSDSERDIFYEADINNVNFTNVGKFEAADRIIEEYAFKVTPEVRKAIMQNCIDRLHLSYGHLQLVGMAWCQIVKNVTGSWPVRNPLGTDGATQVCSEAAGYCLNAMGFNLDPNTLEIQGPSWLHTQIQGWAAQGLCRKL